MGNVISSARGVSTSWWNSSNNGHIPAEDDQEDDMSDDNNDEVEKKRTLSPAKAKELEEFRKQLVIKREERRRILTERSREMQRLKQQLEDERKLREAAENENKSLRELIAQNSTGDASISEQKSEENHSATDLKTSFDHLESEINELKEQNRAIKLELTECHLTNQSFMTDLALVNKENFELKKHVSSLKDVNRVSKDMLAIRESQLNQLKEKLLEIEKSLADRETKMLSNDLRVEYERQLENIRNLRILYEERARVAEVTRQNLLRDLENQKELVDMHTKKCGDLETKVEELEKEISDKNDILGTKEDQLGVFKAETRGLQDEMTVINQLFSKVLLGFNSNQDLDKLVMKLEENHDLLTDMVVREESSETASALPKLVLDLLDQMEMVKSDEEPSNEENVEQSTENEKEGESKKLNSAQEIVQNLPKVWRVLMELLSHQTGPQVVVEEGAKSTSCCYKSIDTPSGPRLVPSVSKTYIRLKDLILEKKSVQKEMLRLKQLNCHLESRLQDQERRLGLVSSELNKTWHIVGRMQRQHQQLHSHEQILRYELQQKRILLKNLREQLEYCKEQWDKAKQKNSESQEEWNKLRLEFSSRKTKSTDSAESGYSDEKASDDDSVGSNNKKNDRKRFKKKSRSPDLDFNENDKNDEIYSPVEANDSDDIEDNLSDGEERKEKDDQVNDEEKQHSRLNSTEKDNTSPGTSAGTSITAHYDEILAARSARLKKLEEQCYVLVHKVTKTNNKGVELCNRLEELHNQYGGSEEESQEKKEEETCVEIETDDQINADTSKEIKDVDIETSKDTETHKDDIETTQPNSSDASKSVDTVVNSTPSTSDRFDYEAKFAAREARLKRLEEQASSLVKKAINTNNRGNEISTKLTDLHNIYGRSEEVQSEQNIQENNESDSSNVNNVESSSSSNTENDLNNDDKE